MVLGNLRGFIYLHPSGCGVDYSGGDLRFLLSQCWTSNWSSTSFRETVVLWCCLSHESGIGGSDGVSSSKTSLVLRNLLSSKWSQLCLSSTASLGYVSHTLLSLPVPWCHQAFWTVGEKFIWEECAPVPYSPQLPLMDVFQDNLIQSAPVRLLSEGSYQMNAMWKLGLGRVGVCHSVKNRGTNSALSLHRGGEKCFLQLLGMIYT